MKPYYISFVLFVICITTASNEVFYINPQNMHYLKQAWAMDVSGHPTIPSYYELTVNNTILKGVRPWTLRWNMIKDACDYEGKRILELGCLMALPSIFLTKYRNIAFARGVDKPSAAHRGHIAYLVAQAFEANIDVILVDLDGYDYENIIGYDYDIVFCMSVLRHIHDKDRLMRYLSCFNHVIFEGHESDAVEINRFAQYGFYNYKILGKADMGRTVIHFFK